MVKQQWRHWWLALLAGSLLWGSQASAAEQYNFDIKGMHAFIQFKVKHLGYSWELGRFNRFTGNYVFDAADPSKNNVNVSIDVASLDTNHAERDKHLRSADFFDVESFPTATFKSTTYKMNDDNNGILTGIFTMRGISKTITMKIHQIGAGKDPWGGFRRGFEGTTTLHLSDYNMKKSGVLGSAAENIEIYISVEGIRQK